ncbi:MAG: N-acetylmuramoyl-L-alanine amidase [Cellulosilyticum sp.]|nr:N-acetylmuramoyl-L-alanine amidase [Cellulosilyticum sp.]
MKKKTIWVLVVLMSIMVGRQFCVPLKAESSVLTNKVIIIDPGHGGFDPGKPGVRGKDEKHLNLEISLLLRDYLENAGAIVMMTRTTDDDVDGMDGVKHKSKDMVERKKISEGGDILVSIHQNSFTQPSVHGAQVFFNQKSVEGKLLAETIQQTIKTYTDETNRRAAKSNTNYYVLKATQMPAVIIECGFLTNPEEEQKLNHPEYQEKMALGIYIGIVKYFEQEH